MRRDLHEESLPEVSKRVRTGTWRETVRARAGRLRAEARWMLERQEFDPAVGEEGVRVQVFDPISRADAYASRDRQGLLEWWGGSQVEEAWRMLRQAEEGLLELVAPPGLPARARVAEQHAIQALGPTDARVQALQKALADLQASPKDPGITAALRVAARTALAGAHETSDLQHQQQRGFRNQLFAVSAVLVLAAGLLFLAQSAFGFTVITTPKGVHLGASESLAIAMFFGCVGALFSAVPSLAVAPTSASPFNMLRPQALLKVVTGGWSAVIGLLVVYAGMAAAAPDTTTVSGLAITAALFGAGQEAVTRFADNKASAILVSP